MSTVKTMQVVRHGQVVRINADDFDKTTDTKYDAKAAAEAAKNRSAKDKDGKAIVTDTNQPLTEAQRKELQKLEDRRDPANRQDPNSDPNEISTTPVRNTTIPNLASYDASEAPPVAAPVPVASPIAAPPVGNRVAISDDPGVQARTAAQRGGTPGGDDYTPRSPQNADKARAQASANTDDNPGTEGNGNLENAVNLRVNDQTGTVKADLPQTDTKSQKGAAQKSQKPPAGNKPAAKPAAGKGAGANKK